MQSKLWLEDAQLNWQLNDHVLAKKLINLCLQNVDPATSLSRATALRIYGEYLGETNSDTVMHLIESLRNSLKLMRSINTSQAQLAERMNISAEKIGDFVLDGQIKAHEAIAKYSDREYMRVKSYMRSTIFEQKKQNVLKSQRTMDEMTEASRHTKELSNARKILKINSDIDKNEITASQTEHDQFLELAVLNYVKASELDASPRHSVIFRIISLWFSNKDSVQIGRHLCEELPKISSYHFMTVLPQVAARLTNSDSDFGKTVFTLMGICRDKLC